jgi:hypothetical protein
MKVFANPQFYGVVLCTYNPPHTNQVNKCDVYVTKPATDVWGALRFRKPRFSLTNNEVEVVCLGGTPRQHVRELARALVAKDQLLAVAVHRPARKLALGAKLVVVYGTLKAEHGVCAAVLEAEGYAGKDLHSFARDALAGVCRHYLEYAVVVAVLRESHHLQHSVLGGCVCANFPLYRCKLLKVKSKR